MKSPAALRKHKFHIQPSTIILFTVLVIFTISLFLLLYWGLLASFKSVHDWEDNKNIFFGWPEKFDLTYYKYIFSSDFKVQRENSTRFFYPADFVEVVSNSFFYAIGCAFFQTLVPCLTAYACARFDFKFTKIYPIIVIFTMVIPIVGSTASEIIMAINLGIYNEIWGLWIMKANFLGIYFLIFHSTFKNLPQTYTEAAKIDGAGNFRILFRIILPLVASTFGTIFLINFVTYWNDYSTPILFLKDRPTIFIAIYRAHMNMGVEGFLSYTPYKIALSLVGILPTLILFIIFNKKLLGNLTVGGIK